MTNPALYEALADLWEALGDVFETLADRCYRRADINRYTK